jgi:NAD(P)-dependent dehydrogenase (short-subunit alcohol dehydrogenase family)
MNDFQGRTVFITGATGGIGFATAGILASRGANIAVADISSAAVEKAAKTLEAEYGIKALPVTLDVTKPDEVKAAIKKTVEVFGRLDHAVNAAGIPGLKGLGAPFAEYPTDDWLRVMDVNCNGVFYCCRDEITAMKNGGSIVNISSTAGIIALPTQAAYIASKHAVIGITRSAAIEHAKSGIRVNAVAPGFTDTQLLHSLSNDGAMLPAMASHVPMKRLAKPAEMGELVAFLLSDKASYINGSVHVNDGAHTATAAGGVV